MIKGSSGVLIYWKCYDKALLAFSSIEIAKIGTAGVLIYLEIFEIKYGWGLI